MLKYSRYIFFSILPLLLIIGFSRVLFHGGFQNIDFLPTGSELITRFQSAPDFVKTIRLDIDNINSFYSEYQNYVFQKWQDLPSWSEIWNDVDFASFFPKLGEAFNWLFQCIGIFFNSFAPIAKMIGTSFMVLIHALTLPVQFITWFFMSILGFGQYYPV